MRSVVHKKNVFNCRASLIRHVVMMLLGLHAGGGSVLGCVLYIRCIIHMTNRVMFIFICISFDRIKSIVKDRKLT